MEWFARAAMGLFINSADDEILFDKLLENPLRSALSPNSFKSTTVVKYLNHINEKGYAWIKNHVTSTQDPSIMSIELAPKDKYGKAITDLGNVLPVKLEIEVENHLPYNVLVSVKDFNHRITLNDKLVEGIGSVNAGETRKFTLHDAAKDLAELLENQKRIELLSKMRFEVINTENKTVGTCDCFDRSLPEPDKEDKVAQLSIFHPLALYNRKTESIQQFVKDTLGLEMFPSGRNAMRNHYQILDHYSVPAEQLIELDTRVAGDISRNLCKKDLSPENFKVQLTRLDGKTMIDAGSDDRDVQRNQLGVYTLQIKMNYLYCPLPPLCQYVMDKARSGPKHVTLKPKI